MIRTLRKEYIATPKSEEDLATLSPEGIQRDKKSTGQGISIEEAASAMKALGSTATKLEEDLRTAFASLVNPTEEGRRNMESYGIQSPATLIDGTVRLDGKMVQLRDMFDGYYWFRVPLVIGWEVVRFERYYVHHNHAPVNLRFRLYHIGIKEPEDIPYVCEFCSIRHPDKPTRWQRILRCLGR